jgi:hypothetical protein
MMNGIAEVGGRADLLDRSLLVELQVIDEAERRAEGRFWREFVEAYPLILGALLGAVSTAMKALPGIGKYRKEWPRMIDFAQWASAAEPALGLAQWSFLEAYNTNRENASEQTLEGSPIYRPLLNVVEGFIAIAKREGYQTNEVRLTAEQLLEQLNNGVNPQLQREKDWPKNARSLSGKLKRLAPALRKAGWSIEQCKQHNQKLWIISLPPPTAK